MRIELEVDGIKFHAKIIKPSGVVFISNRWDLLDKARYLNKPVRMTKPDTFGFISYYIDNYAASV